MHKILISDAIDSIAEKIFKDNNIDVDTITDLTPEDLINKIPEYQGLVVRSATKVTKEIILAAKNLKIIGRAGAGVDNIDIQAAKHNNIVVMNTPGGNTNATAEHALSLIFSLYKNIPSANEGTHKGLWEKKKFKGLELRGKKLGIIGFGNVGKRLSEIALSFGMEVNVFSNSLKSRNENISNINLVTFNDLISKSDIISLHCKPTNDGSPLISYNEIKIMKKNVILINTARGGLINENDLKKALDENIIKGAALDVFKIEPAKENILFGIKNLILTPHIAASTIEAQEIVAEQIADQISKYFIKGELINTVN